MLFSFFLFVYLILTRQQALLAAISEKDANIALLELSASNKKKSQEEVLSLKRDKDRLMHQLKQQVRSSSHYDGPQPGRSQKTSLARGRLVQTHTQGYDCRVDDRLMLMRFKSSSDP